MAAVYRYFRRLQSAPLERPLTLVSLNVRKKSALKELQGRSHMIKSAAYLNGSYLWSTDTETEKWPCIFVRS